MTEPWDAHAPDDPRYAPVGEVPPPQPSTVISVLAGFAGLLLLCVAILLPTDYVVLKPGPVLNTLGAYDGTQLITITGHATYPTSGQLDMTTVRTMGAPGSRVSLISVALAWLRPSESAVPRELYYPKDESAEEIEQQDQAMMVDSQESAAVAALVSLGVSVPADLAVAGVRPKTPATGWFTYGDVIQAVGGVRVVSIRALKAQIRAVRPGRSVTFTVLRAGQAVRVAATKPASAGNDWLLTDLYIDARYQLPFTVTFGLKDVVGPSAGHMFALGVIDKLTAGDMTGGKRIAGTGTIDAAGNVGAIGGIRQKLVGARRAGAQYFLAPAANCNEVVGHVPDGLQVVKTATLKQSRGYVAKIAAGQAAGLPTC
ncbi:PDZ domain-containing protein [Spongisporangium articulatum]|uniref:PDZ domain-containing protein n=1 Tax=Spongisporangium articulatum TaxID=3362603 RepID=A0ABW8APN4_9ACTN